MAKRIDIVFDAAMKQMRVDQNVQSIIRKISNESLIISRSIEEVKKLKQGKRLSKRDVFFIEKMTHTPEILIEIREKLYSIFHGMNLVSLVDKAYKMNPPRKKKCKNTPN